MEYVTSLDWKDENFVSAALHILDKECGRKPVVILNDMVEQHYRKERLPKVSPMDKGQVLKRRLQVAFSNYPVRAALPSKQKTDLGGQKTTSTGLAQGPLYLFAAVPATEALNKTLSVLRQSQSNILGFGLLPVESADLVSTLAKKVGGEEKGKTHWAVFIGQHQNGGLRQIITRNGELALTRMTALQDLAGDAGSWARDVANEFQSTMSYLTRFGYGGEDVLDVMIVAEESASKHLKAMIETPCRLHIMTAQETAHALGVKLYRQESPRYADAIHAGWAGKKAKLALPMDARQINEITKPRQMAMGAMGLLFLGLCFVGYQIIQGTLGVVSTQTEIFKSNERLQTVNQAYEAEVLRQEQLGIDVQLIQNTIKEYERLEKDTMHPLPVFAKIGQALEGALKIDAIKIIKLSNPQGDNQSYGYVDPAAQPEDDTYQIYLQLSFRPDIPPEAAVNEVNKLQQRLSQLLPNYKTEVKKQAFDMSTSAVFMGEAGTPVTDNQIRKADYTAEISIEGAL